MNQREYEKRMKDPHYKGLKVTTGGGREDYVFISYRGNSWKTVLSEIVYKLQTKYKLRIYFDKEFASETNVWVEQFQKNMDATRCRAFLCFFDQEYVTSYATLLELMHAMTKKSGINEKIIPINFDINWNTIKENDADTGLGKEDPDNPSYKKEKEAFDRDFELLQQKEDYRDIKEYYDIKDNQPLRICDCANIMSVLQPKMKHQFVDDDEFYKQHILKAIYRATDGKVFEDKEYIENLIDPKKNTREPSVNIEDKVETVGIITGPAPLQIHKADSASESQPEALPNLVSGCMKKWTYRTKKGANAVILWDGTSKNCKVLKGSIAAKEAPNFAASASAAKKMKDQLVSQGNFSGLTFITDYDCDKISTMINLLNGGSVSMPAEIKGKNLRLAEDDVNSSDIVPLEAETDKQELQSPEPVSSVEPTGSSSGECIYTYKNVRLQCDINSNRCTVLKGSKTQGESPKFATNAAGAKKLKDELKQKRIIENDVFLEDYTGSMATLLNLINGGSVSSTREKEKFVREN